MQLGYQALRRRSRIALAAALATVSGTALLVLPAAPALAAAPQIGGAGTFEYLEADPPLPIGEQLTIANGVAYAGEYLEFSVTGSTASETLSLRPDATPNTANGVVSTVGNLVYLGNGSGSENIGVIDGQYNGTNGRALRVNFTNAFQNPGFETGDLSSWTAVNSRVDLGVTSIASCQTVDTSTYAGNTPNKDDNVPSNPGTYTTAVDSTEHTAGSYSLRLLSTGITTKAGYDVVHGPAVYSAPFEAAQGDKIYFDWRAKAGGDAEHVFGYIVNTSGCAQTEVLDHVGTSDTGTTQWATVETVIPTTGSYRFVFVSGTYDFTGGQAAGASLYIDNVRVYGTKATDDVAQQVARRIRYANGSLDVPATRSVNLVARNSQGQQGSATITVKLTPLPEAPVYLDDVLGPIRYGVAYSDGVTTRAWPFATYALTGTLPTGVTFDPATATLSGTPAVPNEAYSFTITATNASGSTPRTYSGAVRTKPFAFTDADTGQFLVGQAHADGVVADGSPAPTYSVVSGNLPAGVSLNPATGVLTGTPTTAGPYTFTIRATNVEGSLDQAFSGNVYSLPAFIDDALATFVTGAAYADGVSASGIPSPTYGVTAGALPAGLTLNPTTGAVTGTPTADEAPYAFTITATNVAGSASRSYSGTVNTIPRAFTDSTLAQPYVGQPYADGVSANGYPAPAYAVVGGQLPAGLVLNPTTGAITGMPTTGGPYDVTIRATNSVGSLSQRLVGNVFGLPAFADDQVATFVAGLPFSDGVFAIGTPTPTYSISAGSLPAGVTLDPNTGAIVGTPTVAEQSYSFTITASNVAGTDQRSYSGTVETEPSEYVDASIGQPVVGRPLVDGVTANGAQPPTYAVTSGSLPAGLILDPATGAVTGTPTTAGPYSFWVTATNAHGSIAIRVSGMVATELVKADDTVADFHAGTAYSDGVTATGLPAPTYAVTSGSLPAGIALDPATGALTGTPTEPDAPYSFVIEATNLAGSVPFSFVGNVHAAPRGFAGTELDQMTRGEAVTGGVTANGFPAPEYEVTAGELPDGVTLDPATGALSGAPTTGGPYSFEVTATNADGSTTQTFSGVVHSPPMADDSELAGFHFGDGYADGVAASGFPAPVYEVTAGGLPDGLTLDAATGAVTGTPTSPDAAYAFTITATNVVGSIDFTFSGTVVTPPLGFGVADLDPATLGTTFEQTLTASGSPAPTYEITAGRLPEGLSLDPATGVISGTPTAGGPYRFEVTASNDEGSFTRVFTGGVVDVPTSFTDGELAAFQHGTGYGDGLAADGWPAPRYEVSDGRLPTGVSLDPATGALSGTPTVPNEPYRFVVTARNATGAVEREFAGIVHTSPVAPPVADLGVLVAGRPAAGLELGVDVFPAPTFAISSGQLPAGLTLDPVTGRISGTPTSASRYAFTVTISNGAGSVDVELSGTINPADGGFAGLTPARLVDTRSMAMLPAGSVYELDVRGTSGIPSDATALALNVTITDPSAAGYVTVFPCGDTRPDVSNLNFRAGETTSNAVVATVGADGKVCVYATSTLHLVVDVNGAYSPTIGFGQLHPLTPARLYDSRQGSALLPAGSVTRLAILGEAAVPDDATAAVLNVTATQPAGPGYLTVYPCGVERPEASNVNFAAGETVPNSVTAAIGSGGEVCVYASVATHLVVDLDGAYAPSANGHFRSVTPRRVLDTRAGERPAAGAVQVIDLDAVPGLSPDVVAVVLNVTVDSPSASGFSTVFPCGAGLPLASNLNFVAGQTVPNAVVTAVDADHDVCIYTDAPAHVIADLSAIYTR